MNKQLANCLVFMLTKVLIYTFTNPFANAIKIILITALTMHNVKGTHALEHVQ